MQIVLPPELEQLIQRQIAAGKYQSALEVITAGIQLLDQQDDIYQGRLPELQQEAQVGWEVAQRGDQRITSSVFPNLNLTAKAILGVG